MNCQIFYMLCILVVDDDVVIVKFISVIFSCVGYEVWSCLYLVEVLDLFKVFIFDLIISDVVMLYMIGLEFLEQVCDYENFLVMLFILFLSYVEWIDVCWGMNFGVDDYLFKFFMLQGLIIVVDVWLCWVGLIVQVESGIQVKGFGIVQVLWQGQQVLWVLCKVFELFFYLFEYKEVISWEVVEVLWFEKDELWVSSFFYIMLYCLCKSLNNEVVISQNCKYVFVVGLNFEYDV